MSAPAAADRARRAALITWAVEARDRAAPVDVVAAAATRLAASRQLPLDGPAAPTLIRDRSPAAAAITAPDGLLVDPWDLGIVHEAGHDAASRRRGGVHYTPRSVAQGLAAIVLDGVRRGAMVCDPSVGGGAFLLAAAEVLLARGEAVDTVLAGLGGIDVDPLAVEVAHTSLALWGATDRRWPHTRPRLVVADTLALGLAAFSGVARSAGSGDTPSRFDVVIGNPPFQSQLAVGTARDAAAHAALRHRWGVDAGPYCDTAAWFLVAALELVAPGGRISLVLPQSVLAAGDAAPVRERLDDAAALTGLWTGERGVFDADVRVCAPVLEVHASSGSSLSTPFPAARTSSPSGGTASEATVASSSASPGGGEVRTWSGPDVAPGPAVASPGSPGRWGELVARAAGVPPVVVTDAAPLGTWCVATAGFRDQFYGLAPHTVERSDAGLDGSGGATTIGASGTLLDAPMAVTPTAGSDGTRPLVTVGMIEPLRCRWGSGRTYRYAGRRWIAPAVDIAAVEADDPALARWVRDRLHPKVLVATQTKVIEAVVDPDGRWIPSTPVIAVGAPTDRLWHLAAALTSPVATAAAFATAAGTALSGDTVKLSARQVLALPTPVDHDAWDEGARLAAAVATGAVDRRSGLAELGQVMIAAAGPRIADPDTLFDWWWSRVPAT